MTSEISGIRELPFSCQEAGEFDRGQIRTGTMIANRSHRISNSSLGWALVSTSNEHRGTRTWIADKNGSDFVDKGIISEFLAHKKLAIRLHPLPEIRSRPNI
jgi:hypothetical protein